MDKEEAIKIAKRYIGHISERYIIDNVFLFGSYAKGNHTNDSDIDLAIIFKEIDDIFNRRIELMQLRDNDELMIEPHPFLESDFNQSSPLASEVIKSGVKLY